MTSDGAASRRTALGAVGASVVLSEQATRPKTTDNSNARLLHWRRFIGLSLEIFEACADGSGRPHRLRPALRDMRKTLRITDTVARGGGRQRIRLFGRRVLAPGELSRRRRLELTKE